MRRANLLVASLVVALLALPSGLQAQNLTQVYEFVPADGEAAAVEAALAEHATWRAENGDPWEWNVYQVVQGKHTGKFIVRSAGHGWSDFDAYHRGFGSKAEEHFAKTVAPLLESTRSYIAEPDTSVSRWGEGDYSLYSVTTYHLEPGGGEAFYQAVEKFHEAVGQEDHPARYAVVDLRYGAGDMNVRIVTPHESWADFEAPEQSVGELLNAAYGEEEASKIFENFSGSHRGYTNMVVRARPDLSVEGAGQ